MVAKAYFPRSVMHPAMKLFSRLTSLFPSFGAVEVVLSRKVNMLIFLLIRFLIMSAMVVGFSWVALDIHP
jgi:hypothetical protein